MIRAVVAQLEIPTPEIRYDRCLRARLNSGDPATAELARCTTCAAACPQLAVSCTTGVTIGTDRCNSCGLCASACPTDAIRDHGQRLARLDPFSGVSTLSIGCKLGSNDGATWGFPVMAVCGLSWQFLAAAALRCRATLRLDCRYCAGCTNGSGLPAVGTNRSRALSYLEAIGVHREITLVEEGAADPHDGGVSRREFFRTVFGRASGGARDLAGRYGLTRIPAGTVRELLWSAAQGANGGTAMPWAAFTVDSTCTGCARCTRVCPSGAWRIAADNTTRTLVFQEAKCLDCGACGAACPAGAIHRHDAGPVSAYDDEVVKATVRGKRCRRCGTFLEAGAAKLCGNCKKQASLVRSEDLSDGSNSRYTETRG